MSSSALYSCSEDELAQVTDYIGSARDAQAVCAEFDCSVSAAACVMRYLTAGQKDLDERMAGTANAEVGLGLDVMFVLFSAYCVFFMQLGFALVRTPMSTACLGVADMHASACSNAWQTCPRAALRWLYTQQELPTRHDEEHIGEE